MRSDLPEIVVEVAICHVLEDHHKRLGVRGDPEESDDVAMVKIGQ